MGSAPRNRFLTVCMWSCLELGAASCIFPRDGVQLLENVTISESDLDSTANYIVKLRANASADAIETIKHEILGRAGVTVPDNASIYVADTSAAGAAAQVFSVFIYRLLRGPAIRGFAGCLSPAAVVYFQAHPSVDGACERCGAEGGILHSRRVRCQVDRRQVCFVTAVIWHARHCN